VLLKPAKNQWSDTDERLLPTKQYDLRAAFGLALPWAARQEESGGSGSGEGNDSGSGEGEGGSGDADGTGAGSSDDGAGSDVKDPEKQRLSQEAAQWRTKLREQEALAKDLADKLRQFEDKDKSELEKAQRDATEYKQRAEKAEAKLSEFAVKMAFFESGAAALFRNAATGLRLIDLDGIAPDDEGKVDSKAIKAKAEALLKEQPYLAADGDSSSGTGESEGQPSGRPNNGKKSKDQVDYEALAKKFPALRR